LAPGGPLEPEGPVRSREFCAHPPSVDQRQDPGTSRRCVVAGDRRSSARPADPCLAHLPAAGGPAATAHRPWRQDRGATPAERSRPGGDAGPWGRRIRTPRPGIATGVSTWFVESSSARPHDDIIPKPIVARERGSSVCRAYLRVSSSSGAGQYVTRRRLEEPPAPASQDRPARFVWIVCPRSGSSPTSHSPHNRIHPPRRATIEPAKPRPRCGGEENATPAAESMRTTISAQRTER
jgi:hypothetical protein